MNSAPALPASIASAARTTDAPAVVLSPPAARRQRLADLGLAALTAVLLFATVLTGIRQLNRRHAAAQMAQDLRISATAIGSHLRQRGAEGLGRATSTLPRTLKLNLTEVDWSRPTPVGGRYRWLPARPGQPADSAPGCVIVDCFPPNPPLTLTRAELLRIDREVDDGDLTKGNFRAGFNGWPLWVVRGN